MYGFFWEYLPFGRLWLDRLLIDRRFQGRGYGRAALAALLGLCVLLAILVMACAPLTETADVAILMYHAFTEDEADTGSLCTPASEFERQLSALRDEG